MAVNTHAVYSDTRTRWMRFLENSGSQQYVSIKGLTTFTWEAWVKQKPEWSSDLNSLNKSAVWYEAKPNRENVPEYTLPRFVVSVTNTHVRFSLSVLDSDGLSHYTYPYDFHDEWTHIAFAVNTGEQEYDIFINGALVQSGALVGGGIDVNDDPLPISDTTPSLVSGFRGFYNNVSQINSLWNGGLECPRLWNTRRSQSDIANNMNDFVSMGVPNLIYQFDLDDVTTNGRIYGLRSANIEGEATMRMIVSSGSNATPNKTTDRPFLGNGVSDTTPPSTPVLQAPSDVGPTGFTLNWSESTDNVTVDRYEVDIATDSGYNNFVGDWRNRSTVRGRTVTFDEGVPNGAYYARVRAVDSSGNASPWSTYGNNAPIITQSVADYTAPSIPPQNLRVMALTSNTFKVEWDRGADVDEVAGYKVFVGLTPSFSVMVPHYRNLDVGLNTQVSVDTDILPLTAYWVKVRSYDQNANESWDSEVLQVVTRALPDLEPPAEVAMDLPTAVESTRFTLRWFETTDNVGVEGYIVDIARDPEFERPVEGYHSLDVGKTLRSNIFGLQELTTYFARVRAYDQAGNISPFTAEPQQITTTALTSSEDGVVEVGSQVISFSQDGTEYPESGQSPATLTATSQQPIDLQFAEVTAVGRPIDLEMFVWVDELVGEDVVLEVTQGNETLGSVKPFQSESWVSIQIQNPPEDLLTGTNVTLRVGSDGGEITIGTGLTQENPSPSVVFHLDTEQVIRPIESDIFVNFETARNFIPSPEFLHETQRDFGHERSLGVTDDFGVDDNWGVVVRKSTMTNGGDISFYSDFITDSTNYLDMDQQVRGSIYLGIIDNAGSQTPEDFDLQVGVEYTDDTTDIVTEPIEVVHGLHHYHANNLNIDKTKPVSRVFIRVRSKGPFAGTLASYMPTVYQGPQQLMPFSGNTYAAKWEEELNFGTSSLSYPTISGELSYIGDNNDNSAARLALLSRDVGLTTNSWFGLGLAQKDSDLKIFTAETKSQFIVNYLGNGSFDITESTTWYPSLLGVGHTMELGFGGKNLDGDPSRIGYRHLNVNLVEKDPASSDMLFGVSSSQVIPKHAINGYVFRTFVRGKEGTDLHISLRDSSSTAVEQLHVHTFQGDGWEEVSFTVPLNTVMFSGYIRLHASTADYESGEKFSVDGIQIGADIPFFTDETFKGAFSAGAYGRSPVMAFLPYTGVQDVVWLVDDPDGVDSESRMGMTGTVTDVTTIEGAPDNVLTVKDLKAEATEHTIRVVFEYEGDDQRTADLDIKWRRADFTEERSWNRVPVSWNRSTKTATALITDLTPRTSYTVVATASDELLPIYGENPIQRTFTTKSPQIKGLTTPRILFGGFVLQDDNVRNIWVDHHNAFDHPERNLQVDKLPRYQGSVELSDWWEKKVITITGGISGRTRQELAENLNALRLALSKGQERLVVDTLDQRNFYYTATCTSLKLPETAGENFRHLKWTATFTCADPFRYDSKEEVEEDVSMLNGETITITNFGDLEISPEFTITTASPTPVEITLINQTTGQRITPEAKIKSGDTLQILNDQLKATKNGVLSDFSGSFMHLDTGENTIEVQTHPISYPVSVTIRRRHKYF